MANHNGPTCNCPQAALCKRIDVWYTRLYDQLYSLTLTVPLLGISGSRKFLVVSVYLGSVHEVLQGRMKDGLNGIRIR